MERFFRVVERELQDPDGTDGRCGASRVVLEVLDAAFRPGAGGRGPEFPMAFQHIQDLAHHMVDAILPAGWLVWICGAPGAFVDMLCEIDRQRAGSAGIAVKGSELDTFPRIEEPSIVGDIHPPDAEDGGLGRIVFARAIHEGNAT